MIYTRYAEYVMTLLFTTRPNLLIYEMPPVHPPARLSGALGTCEASALTRVRGRSCARATITEVTTSTMTAHTFLARDCRLRYLVQVHKYAINTWYVRTATVGEYLRYKQK